MRTGITTKLIAVATATIIAQATDKVLSSIVISEQEARLLREVIKAVAATIASATGREHTKRIRREGGQYPGLRHGKLAFKINRHVKGVVNHRYLHGPLNSIQHHSGVIH